MYQPKEEIYQALRNMPARVAQSAQSVFSELPTVTFSLSNNRTNLDLDNNISSQEIDVTVDVWTETSSEGSSLLSEAENIMRGLGYRLTSTVDVPNPDGALQHLSCHFETVR